MAQHLGELQQQEQQQMAQQQFVGGTGSSTRRRVIPIGYVPHLHTGMPIAHWSSLRKMQNE
jgi:hypothetical protein